MRKFYAVLVVSVCSLSLLGARQQQPGGAQAGMMMGGGMMNGAMMGRFQGIIGELKLTDDQKKDLDRIKFDAMKQMIAQVSKIATMRVELQEQMQADKPDRAALEKKIDELTSQAGSIGKMMVGQWFAVNKILTPEQQKIWKRVLEMRPMMNRRMGGMPMMRERMKKMHEEKEEEEDDKK